MTKKAKATFDIKKKLMGAVAMLLVATIMMVSATYAWFTLSTAPEVKGISTTVGGNGNLEIALRYDDDTAPTTGTSDSMDIENKAVEESNITWGNLVDLSKNEYYGTNNLNLYPAKLDLNDQGKVSDKILAFPTYGVDGRVTQVTNARTYIHTFDGTSFSDKLETATDEAEKRPTLGVRAIGTSSGLSEAEQAFRAAKSQLNTDNASARSSVESILNNNGSGITAIIIKHANDEDDYTAEDVATVKATATAMETAVSKIEAALIQALVAYSKSGNTSSVEAINDVLAAVQAEENPVSLLEAIQGKTLPIALTPVLTEFSTLSSKVAEVKSSATALSDGTATWTQISGVMNKLLDSDGVTITGKKLQEIWDEAKVDDPDISRSDAVKAYVMTLYSQDPTSIVVGIPGDDDGALRMFADFVGRYSSTVQIPASSLGIGVSGISINSKLQVETNKPVANLPMIYAGVNLLPAPTGDGVSSYEVIDDVYGYALDLWVRTNAKNGNDAAKLQLSSGEDRIYAGGTDNPNTMGDGSYMQFDYDSATLTNVRALMNAIRLVFVDGEKEILCYGKLDVTNAEEIDNDDPEKDALKAAITLYNMVVPEGETEAVEQAITYIMDLPQNQATKLTVIVYLDGETVDNSAAVNAAIASAGKMNLQFKTDVTLVPMENSALKTAPEQQNNNPSNGGEGGEGGGG